MKITKLHVKQWRHFRNLTIETSQNDTVCLVGENGTGKTALLELLVSVAGNLGLTGGYRGERANPLSEPGSVDVYISFDPNDVVRLAEQNARPDLESFKRWDGMVRFSYATDAQVPRNLVAAPDGSLSDDAMRFILQNFVMASRRASFLYLDANRSYTAIQINDNVLVERMRKRDYNEAEQLNLWKDLGSRPSTDLYREWEMAEVGREAQSALEHFQRAKDAVTDGLAPPIPENRFAEYSRHLSLALPHLGFAGARVEHPMGLLFSSAEAKLRLCELSGGEREIAFILGQLLRFNLGDGLLIIDEPELHLNPDLVRSWITAIRSLMTKGQLWIATHSMEAVEAVGSENTFVLARSDDNRTVDRAFRLSDNEVYTTLSNALGTPGFSVQRLKFVYVEGNSESRESQRFIELCDTSPGARYIDAGNCREVVRKVSAVKELADTACQPLRVGGVIDRDFRSEEELERHRGQGIFVLGCHEIENLYLHPPSLAELVRRAASKGDPAGVILSVADEQAGRWIMYKALYDMDYRGDTSRELRLAVDRPWNEICDDPESFVANVAALIESLPNDQAAAAIRNAAVAYKEMRAGENLWLQCRGKEALSVVAQRLLGITPDRLRQTLHVLWRDDTNLVPDELTALKRFVDQL